MPKSRSRSRSRSPKRERKRSRSRSRSRDRDRHRRHRRSRSRDKGRRRSRERRHDDRRRGGRDRGGGGRRRRDEEEEVDLVFTPVEKPQVTEEELKNMPESEQELMRVMGFSGFDTTKNKQVVGNDTYTANICKKRRYRQYMNRKGGFNRPLDFIA